MHTYRVVCSLLLLFSGAAFGQCFHAKALAEKMDAYSAVIPHAHTYIKHCGASFIAGGVEACTIHNSGPYFIQLAVPNPAEARLRIQLVAGGGPNSHGFRRYGGPALLSFLMSVTGAQNGGLYLFETLSKHTLDAKAHWHGVRVFQVVTPHAYTWTAKLTSANACR